MLKTMLVAFLVAVALSAGVATSSIAAVEQQAVGKPILGKGTWDALQIGDMVFLWAKGTTPTPNYAVWIEPSPIAVFPPEFSLYWQAPGGVQVELMTPFVVQTIFYAKGPVATITVHDADGAHKVVVRRSK